MNYQLPKDQPDYLAPKEKRSLAHPESKLQQACVTWFNYQYAPLKGLLYANANGGQRSKTEAKIMKGEGVQSGIPDLMLAVARGEWHGLYVELKVPPNMPTQPQRAMMEKLTQQGYYCQVVFSKEQFISLITNYLSIQP